MGIKKYIIASLLLVIAVVGYVFSIASGDYRIELFEQVVILPVAIWVIAPTIVLFIASLLHMSFYGLRNYFSIKGVQKDTENLMALINQRLLNQTSTQTFKNKEIKEFAKILEQVDFNIGNTNFTTSNKKVQEVVEQIININGGQYVSDKKLQLATKSSLMQTNLKNRINIDSDFALEVIKQPALYTQDIISEAFIKAIDAKSITTIKKLLSTLTLDVKMFKALIKKDSKEDIKFALDNEALLNIITKLDLTTKDLIELIKEYKETIAPERLIKLFEDLVTKDEKYTESYLFVLSEYEMINDIREILVNSQPNEYAIYKAYLDLRDANKHYSLDTFFA